MWLYTQYNILQQMQQYWYDFMLEEWLMAVGSINDLWRKDA